MQNSLLIFRLHRKQVNHLNTFNFSNGAQRKSSLFSNLTFQRSSSSYFARQIINPLHNSKHQQRAAFSSSLNQTKIPEANYLLFEDIPSPKGLPIFGTTLSLILSGGASKLHAYADKRHKNLGPIFKESLGNIEAVFISNPDYMRAVFAQEGKYPIHVLPEAWMLYNKLYGCSRGLFFMDGEEWLKNRRIMNKLLLKAGADYGWIKKACVVSARDLIGEMNDIYGENSNLEFKLYKWSLDTIIAVLLGDQTYLKSKEKLQPVLKNIAKKVNLIFETSAKLQFIPAALAAKYEIKAWRDFKVSVDEALAETNELVEGMLSDFPKNDGLLGLMTNEGMPKEDVVKIVVDLVLAAGDTTAYTMQWVLYLLAKNQNQQENLYQEIFNRNYTEYSQENLVTKEDENISSADQEIIGSKNSICKKRRESKDEEIIGPNKPCKNHYKANKDEEMIGSKKPICMNHYKANEDEQTLLLKNFIKETLRLYPVAPFLTRILPEDSKIGPYLIPKHTLILYSLFTSGRDAEYFENPSSFKPERWRSRSKNMAQASLPFAMGSRSCIGRKIAEFQLQIALKNIIEEFKIEMKSEVDVDIVLKMVAVPDKPLELKLTKRQML